MGVDITSQLWKVINLLSSLELPPGAYLLLVLIAIFTRDGLIIEREVSKSDNDMEIIRPLAKRANG